MADKGFQEEEEGPLEILRESRRCLALEGVYLPVYLCTWGPSSYTTPLLPELGSGSCVCDRRRLAGVTCQKLVAL
jgi:hypothetical protein